jgi:hypothetical protein
VNQEAAEMKGRKVRIVPFRNIHVRTPEALRVLSLCIHIYLFIYLYVAYFYYTISPSQDYKYNLRSRT